MTAQAAGIFVGAIIRTNYGTGPYVVKRMTEGCTCTHYVGSEPHLHLVVQHLRRNRNGSYDRSSRDSYLNGYVLQDDGRIIVPNSKNWSGCVTELFVEGVLEGAQAELTL